MESGTRNGDGLKRKNFDTGDDWSGNLSVLEEHDLSGARNQYISSPKHPGNKARKEMS